MSQLWSPTSPSFGSPTAASHEPRSPTMASRVRNPGRRFAQMVKLKPEYVEQYKSCHAKVWPEVLKQIKECNIVDCEMALASLSSPDPPFSGID